MKEDAAAFEPAIWEDTEVAMLDDDTSWEHRAPRPQRSGAPYPFRRAVCPPLPSLSIARSSFPCPVTATKMLVRLITANADFSSILSPQIASPVLSRDGNLKKRGVSREDEPIVEKFKRRTTEEAMLSSKGKNRSSKGAHQDAPGYVDRRDELRRELLSLFNERREPSREQ
jgi:hypothetical protein